MKINLAFPIIFFLLGMVLTGCTPKYGLNYNPDNEYRLKMAHLNQTVIISKCIDQRQIKDCDGFTLTNSDEQAVCGFVKQALEHYKLFREVLYYQDGAIPPPLLTNNLLEIRVKKLSSNDPNKNSEAVEGAALGLLSIPGVIIASQIKVSHIQEVQMEFRLIDGGTQQIAFNKLYSAARTISFKGGDFSLAREATTNLDICLGDVIDDFAIDLSNTPLSGDIDKPTAKSVKK